MARRPNQSYTPLRPDADGNPVGGGYKCGACGLEGLAYGEPHYRSAGIICEPHPEGQEVITYAPLGGGIAVRSQGGAPVAGTTATPLHPDLINDLSRLSPKDRNAIHEQVRSSLADNAVATAAAKGEVDGAGQHLNAAYSKEQTAEPSITPGGEIVNPADIPASRADSINSAPVDGSGAPNEPISDEPTAAYGNSGMGAGGGGYIESTGTPGTNQPHDPLTEQPGGETTDPGLPYSHDTVPFMAAPGESPGGAVAGGGQPPGV